MWIFTEYGFVSVVATKPGSAIVRVRARDHQSLEDISAQFNVGIDKSPERDYPYRVELTKEQFAKWVTAKTLELDYTNFKSRVAETRGYNFAHALGSVWSTMHDVEDAGARDFR